VALSNVHFGQYHMVRQTHNDDQPDAIAVHAGQAVDVNIPGTPGSPNCVFWPLCVKLPTGLTTTAVPEVNTSSAWRASSNVIGASSTVYPLDSASSSIDRRVMPGRMVPYIQPGRPQMNQLLGKTWLQNTCSYVIPECHYQCMHALGVCRQILMLKHGRH